MSNHYEKMKFEMELRGYSQHTIKHYLNHVQLLERFCNKPLEQISPIELVTAELKKYILSK